MAQNARTGRAYLYAFRIESLGDTVIAPIAFLGGSPRLIETARTVRACLYAILAADTIGRIDQHRTVFGLKGSSGRAHLHTRRMLALVAQLGHKKCLGNLDIPVAVIKTEFCFRPGIFDIFRISLTIDECRT